MQTPHPPAAPIDLPIFVLGERPAAMQLVRALGDTSTLCRMPATRLLSDLVAAADRWAADFADLPGSGDHGLRPASWYREVQVDRLRSSGKSRTVEFSALPVLQLCRLFPTAQIVVVRQLTRAVPRSRRLPALEQRRILEVDSDDPTSPGVFEHVLAFLGETVEAHVLDLSDHTAESPRVITLARGKR
jgi:hypothetical protein